MYMYIYILHSQLYADEGKLPLGAPEALQSLPAALWPSSDPPPPAGARWSPFQGSLKG